MRGDPNVQPKTWMDNEHPLTPALSPCQGERESNQEVGASPYEGEMESRGESLTSPYRGRGGLLGNRYLTFEVKVLSLIRHPMVNQP